MALFEYKKIAPGLAWVAIPSRQVFIQCGCPADSVKHLIQSQIIKNKGQKGVLHETGPNVLLLADLNIQNGQLSNMAEFSSLQMFYRQGMMIPGHPGFSSKKPVMIGHPRVLRAQLDYVFRGNYGLVSIEEMMEAGLSAEEAEEQMRLKLSFAFGAIRPSDELFDTRLLESSELEIMNGVFVRRLSTNVFEFRCEEERVQVDLNLAGHESYLPTYRLNFQRIAPEFFSIIHTGEGDGWDVRRPAMASIVCYGPDIYLIDAGPHVSQSLRALGLSLNSIRGIFQTHAHDDHLAGLTELMLGDRKLEYFSTKLVRHSVNKKLQALINVDFPVLERFFDTQDLNVDVWNNIDGLEVMPIFSPHPVETNNFLFRVVTPSGYKSYHHLADIASFATLQRMIEPDKKKPGISQEYFKKIKAVYQMPADLKKVDIGGGLIHGQAEDFKNDRSGKIIFSHRADELTPAQLVHGTQAIFGQTDHLVKSYMDNRHERAARSLHHYFPTVPFNAFYELLNHPIESIDPGKPLATNAAESQDIYLVLSGIISDNALLRPLEFVAGYLIGIDGDSNVRDLVAKSFAEILRMPRRIFDGFLQRYDLKEAFAKSVERRRNLQESELFHPIRWSPLLHKIAKSLQATEIKKDQIVRSFSGQFLFLLQRGSIELFKDGYSEVLTAGQFCYEDNMMGRQAALGLQIRALEECEGFLVPHVMIKDIPAVAWKMLEAYKRRSQALEKIKMKQTSAA